MLKSVGSRQLKGKRTVAINMRNKLFSKKKKVLIFTNLYASTLEPPVSVGS